METSLAEMAATGDLSAQTLPDLLTYAAARFAERPALWFMGRRWRYRDVAATVDRLAAGLQRIGVGPGVKVGLCLPNTPYSVLFFHAVLKAGGVVVNYNPLYVAREIAAQMADSETAIMVAPDLARILAPVLEAGATRVILCPMRGILPPVKALALYTLRRREISSPRDQRIIPFAALLKGSGKPAPVSIKAGDLAVLQYTGGTTGMPKGAMLSQASLLANAMQALANAPNLQPGTERLLAVLPLFHVMGMSLVMNTALAIGAELILLPRFDIDELMRTIARARPTVFPLVPTICVAVSQTAERHRIDISSVKTCFSGSAPLPREVRAKFEAQTGCRVIEGYGLSETAGVASSNPLNGVMKDNSVGPAVLETVIEIRDPDHPERILGVGEKGEICIRGPQVMMGYWKRPEENMRAFIDGAFRTGDIGYLDEDGYLFIVDRLKDLIIAGGYNIYPRVIEEALYRHPKVLEAMVIGVPDRYRGEAPRAYVVLRPGEKLSTEELLAFLAGEVSKIEMPRDIVFRASLPKTAIGKLSKKALHEEEARLRESGGSA